MRFSRIDRFLLVLAALFVLAALRGRSLPGEEVLPDLYSTFVQRPLLAATSGEGASETQQITKLESQVASLEREVRQLRDQVADTRRQGRFFAELKWPTPPRSIPAWVTGIDPDPWQRAFNIGAGRADGVKLGRNGHQKLAVVSGRALLGIVIEAERRISTVRRIDDDRFRLEVELQTPEGVLRGIIRGQGSEQMTLRFVHRARELADGMPVFTSSFDRDIPPGLLVGRIRSVKDAESDGIFEVAVEPASAFVRLGQVEVLVPRGAR